MKNILFLFILLVSCSTSPLESNRKYIKSIESLPFTDCTIRLQVDSNGQVIDTISIIRIKKNEGNQKVFEQQLLTVDSQKYLVNKYYWEDGVDFLEKIYSESGELKTYSEVFKDDNEIIQKYVGFDVYNGQRDSLILDYRHVFNDNNRRSKLVLTSINLEDTIRTIKHYGEKEQMGKEITILSDDTIEVKFYFYRDTLLKEIKRYRINRDTTFIYNQYDSMGNLVKQTEAIPRRDSIVETKISSFEYDVKNKLTGYSEKMLTVDQRRIVKIIETNCD